MVQTLHLLSANLVQIIAAAQSAICLHRFQPLALVLLAVASSTVDGLWRPSCSRVLRPDRISSTSHSFQTLQSLAKRRSRCGSTEKTQTLRSSCSWFHISQPLSSLLLLLLLLFSEHPIPACSCCKNPVYSFLCGRIHPIKLEPAPFFLPKPLMPLFFSLGFFFLITSRNLGININ